ncbi:MAG: intermembrane phospholipid transport protein YdbH family protein, partial [Planctomycetota bacterium]
MTATFGRALAFALAGLVLLLFALWLASPLWLPPLAHTFLADNDVELLALDSGWIRPDGVDVAALEVRAPGLSLRAEGLRLAWSATTGLRVLTVDHVAAGWTAPDPQAPAAPPTDALPVPPAPRELFAALPVERIELRALSAVAAFADGRRLGTEGSATIDATGMRYAGEATLPGGSTTSLQASLTPAGALELRLGSDRGGPMVSAEGHVGGRAGATTVRGTVVVRAGTLPALLPSTPDVAGTLLLEGVVGAQDAELTIRPGTDLTLAARPPDASGPELTVTWTPRERWSIALADGRLDSTGHADLLFEARHEELEATGAVSLREIAGPEDALDFTVDAQATVAEGPRSAAVRTTLRGALHDLATLTLRAGEVLRVARLEDPVAAVALEDVVVSLRDPATIALDA